MKIVRTLDREDLRNFCIKFNLCTNCDNDTYKAILDISELNFNPNSDYDIEVLARLIWRHSEDQTISNIMYLLANHCLRYTVEQ